MILGLVNNPLLATVCLQKRTNKIHCPWIKATYAFYITVTNLPTELDFINRKLSTFFINSLNFLATLVNIWLGYKHDLKEMPYICSICILGGMVSYSYHQLRIRQSVCYIYKPTNINIYRRVHSSNACAFLCMCTYKHTYECAKHILYPKIT